MITTSAKSLSAKEGRPTTGWPFLPLSGPKDREPIGSMRKFQLMTPKNVLYLKSSQMA